MFEWLIKQMINLAVSACSYFVSLLTTTFQFDLVYFTNQFSIIAQSYKIFQTMGLGLVMLFLIWQCFKTFGAPLGIEGDEPFKVFLKSLLAVFCIYHAQELFNLGFEFFKPIFDQINGLVPNSNITWNSSYSTANGVWDAVTLFSGLSFVQIIIFAILIIVIMWNLLKMLIELTERYILMGILAVTSPLGFATMTNKGTANIFAAWSRMVMGQFVIYLLNLWIIKLFLNALAGMPPIANTTDAEKGSAVIWFIFMLAFLRVAQKMDQYLGKLGIEIGQTGGSLMEELMIGKMAAGAISKGGGLFGGGKSGGGIAAALTNGATGGFGGGIASVLTSKAARGAAGAAAGLAGAAVVGGAAGAVKGVVGGITKGSPLGGLINYGNPFRGVGEAAKAGTTRMGSIGRGVQQFGANVANAGLRVDRFKAASAARTLNTNPAMGGAKFDTKLKSLTNQNGVTENLVNGLNREVGGERGKNIMKGLMNGKTFGDLTPEMVSERNNFTATAYNGGVEWSYSNGVKELKGQMAVQGDNAATKKAIKFKNENQNAFNYTANAAGGKKISCVYTKTEFDFLK